eukprot:COSAG02_NODE_9_length_59728_cov_36.104714_25_plen_53_part_00
MIVCRDAPRVMHTHPMMSATGRDAPMLCRELIVVTLLNDRWRCIRSTAYVYT